MVQSSIFKAVGMFDNSPQEDFEASVRPLTDIDQKAIDRLIAEGGSEMERAISALDLAVGKTTSPNKEELNEQAKLIYHVMQASYWALGDRIRAAWSSMGRMESYRISSRAIDRSTRWSLDLAKTAEAFPPKHRFMGVEWNLYRACAYDRDPIAMLYKALREGLSADDVRRIVNREKSN
jgi:hypothetical protein